MKYKFKWRRLKSVPWWTSKIVAGHRYDKDQDKMVLYLENGSLQEIAKWQDCEAFLGVDWVLATKEQMEREANQSIKVNI